MIRSHPRAGGLRVAFITQPWDQILPSRGTADGSIAILTYEVAHRLARQGHHVCIYGAGPRLDLKERVEHTDGIEIRVLPGVRAELKLFNLAHRIYTKFSGRPERDRPGYASSHYLSGFGWQLARAIQKHGYDVVHVHNLFQIVPALRALNPDVKIILQMHSEWLSQIARDVIERSLSGVDLVIGVSDHITQKVQSRFPDHASHCRTIYNGVSLESFAEGAGSAGRKDRARKRLLFVGRISPEKGIHLLIDAFEKVHRKFPDAVLDIVGPATQVPFDFLVGLDDNPQVASLATFYDQDKPSYFEQIKARTPISLGGWINYLGGIPYGDMVRCYENADVFVNATFSDSFSMPTAEAMANGLPVVAPRVGGVQEIVVHNETGVLFDVGNTDMLAEGIERLLSDDALRDAMGAAGRKRIVESFSWEGVVGTIEGAYREVLQ